MFGVYASVYYVVAVLVRYDDLNPVDMYITILLIMSCTMSVGNNSQVMGDVGQATNSAKNIFKILDAEDEYELHNKIVPTEK